MKHFILLLLLLPFFTTAQEVVKDSFWLTREAYETTDTNGKSAGLNWTFIRNTYFEFDDLSGRLEKLPLGDTAQTRGALVGWQVDMIRQHSYHAVQAMKKNQIVNDWQQVNVAMKAIGLGGLDSLMQETFEGQFLGDAQVKIGGANFVPADVVKNAQGNIRLVFGGSGYRVTLYADTMLRVLGYPATGQNVDLYKVRERVFRNVENTFTLRLR